MMNKLGKLILSVMAILTVFSCSTTRVLQEDQYRLAKNKIVISNDKDFNTKSLDPYLKQKPNSSFIYGWTPLLSVYNWANGKGKGWDKLVKKVGIAPVVYDAEMVESSIVNIMNHLEYLGYYGSTINSDIEVRRKNVIVTYDITLGKRYPIKSFDIILPPEGEFTSTFLADSSLIETNPGKWLSESSLENESKRIADIMNNRGFYSFNKNNFFFEADTLSVPDSAILTMTINEYTRNETAKDAEPIERFYFNNVSISYPKTLKFNAKILRDLTIVSPGNVYNNDDLKNTYTRLSALRVFNSVNINTEQQGKDSVNCNIVLSQSKLQGFKVNLEASSNSTGLFGISPQLSYYHKNIFHGGEWLNLSFMGNFQFMYNNSSIKSNEFGVSGSLSLPRFFPLSYSHFKAAIPRTDINVSYNFQHRPEYRRNIISTSYGYNGNIDNRFYYQAYPIQLNIVRLLDLDPDFYNSLANDPFLKDAYQDHFDLGLGGTVYYTTNSSNVPKTDYFYTRFQFDVAGNLLSAFKPLMDKDADGAGMIWNTPYSQFIRGELTLTKTWFFGKNSGHSIATRFLAGAGYAYGNSQSLPFEKHFYSGGANSLRGWQARTVGPGLAALDKSFVIPNQTGDMKLEANIEYRFNLFWKLAGALFLDAGNVWTLRDDDSVADDRSIFRWNTFGESIAANWGAGIRLDFNFLILRLDLGIKIHDPARENKWINPSAWLHKDNYAVHFGVGYPF